MGSRIDYWILQLKRKQYNWNIMLLRINKKVTAI